jgi:hypothetical protein
MRKTNLFAVVAALAAGTAFAQGMPSSPSTGPSTSSPSTSSPSTGSAAGGSGYLSSPDTGSNSSAKGGDVFGKLDKDTDGMVSKTEAKKDKDLGKQFDTLDSNKDGKLDNAEFSVFESGSISNQK